MKRLDDLRMLLKSFFNRQVPRERKMIRVFQFRRYLEWKDLSLEEKLLAKRLLMLPIFAILIMDIFNQNLLLIISSFLDEMN